MAPYRLVQHGRAGFMWYWPITLALVSRAAPAKVNATLIGVTFLSLLLRLDAHGLGRQLL